MTTYIIGDLLTGRRIQTVPVLSGPWDDALNETGSVSITVTLRDPDVAKLGLFESALPGKAFLAAIDGDTVLQAGPIWAHDYDGDNQELTIHAAGMWSYFDHRMLLPVLAGRLPSDPTTDTNFRPVSVDPEDPWPADTTSSLQGIARALVAQAQTETNGNVPVVLPATIPGTNERRYRGADLAPVGQRLKELTEVENGPDIQFLPRWTTDKLGIEWVMRIGTPTQPLLFSLVEPVFTVGVPESSVSSFSVSVNGAEVGSRAFVGGGRSTDTTLTTVSVDPTLLVAGFPVLDLKDTTHSTVQLESTLQQYGNENVMRARKPVQTWAFTHNLATSPYLSGFNVGDFAKVRMMGDPYIKDGEYRMRILSRAGDAEGEKVALQFQPVVS